MALDGWDRETSPYHSGEQELQDRLGRKELQESMARRIHHPFMPDQHREFYAQLPFFVAGSVDDQGWPWASILFGDPGFVSTPDDRTINIDTALIPGDPVGDAAKAGAPMGFLGIELPTRRRNRVNGVVSTREGDRIVIDVAQSYGNCPQYIHTREPAFTRKRSADIPVEIDPFTDLASIAKIIHTADTFFVASQNPHDDARDTGGVDVSHRGGRPGFVKLEGNTLTIPDFIGNFAFNTLGNFLVNPRAGLIFVDFETGDLVQMVGTVELIWDADEEVNSFKGAERAWRFSLDHGHVLKAAAPLEWTTGEASRNSLLTGTWDEADATRVLEETRAEWRAFRVGRIQDESSVIRSFYLEPTDGKPLMPYLPGQYLTIRVTPGKAAKPVVRTYTLSSAPSDTQYRISVKREEAGAVSKHLHDAVSQGDVIETRTPRGSFWLGTDEKRPAVLIAAGVGITPMISMARQALTDGFSRRHLRPLTVIHAARTTTERAFVAEFGKVQEAAQGSVRYISLIEQPAEGEEAGREFHAAGRLSPEVLQQVLPLADYDFFLCGPPPFMQAVYDMLIELGVRDQRIFAETFGPASLKRQQDTAPEVESFSEPKSATVSFAASGFEQGWTPEDGTLLDFAEAHGLTPEFGCRSGNCGTCAVRLKKGEIGYRTKPDFPTEEDEVLICCAVPAESDSALELDL